MAVFPEGCEGCGCLAECIGICEHKGMEYMSRCPCPECIVKVNCSQTCLEFDIFVEAIFYNDNDDKMTYLIEGKVV